MINSIVLVLRLLAAGILLQTLYFKFTGAPESVYIFSSLGVEPWGRYFSGVVELFAGLLLLIPSTQVFGALIGAGVMVGAILSHAFVLGVVIQNDGGLLFTLACAVFLSCIAIVWIRRAQLLELARAQGLLRA